MISVLLIACVVAAPPGASRMEGPTDHPVEIDFSRDIRPILAAKCFACHGPDGSSREAGLRLDTRDGAVADLGDGFHAIVPGDLEASELWFRVGSDDPELRMPPKGEPLSAAELDLLRRWIEAGATYEAHWAYEPVADPEVPAVEWRDGEAATGEIDPFIARSLRRADLVPSVEADRRTLIRRATLDLTGLPPTTAEVEAFLADGSPGAYERLVDRLLASPAYGERWGRHWLDVARYADSNGVDENTAFANAHRYRDWVVRAFNGNLPFDEFLRLQIAGDLTPAMHDADRAADALTATGFLAIGPKVLAEPDKEKMVFDIVDEQVDVVGKAFLAQTLSCARCHDHKFDPISQEAYFGFVGVFKSTKTMSTLQTVARTLERHAESIDEAAARQAHVTAVAEATSRRDEAVATARLAVQARWRDRFAELAAAASTLPESPAEREAEEGPDLVNLLVDHDRWGPGIGVVRSTGGGPGRATWAFDVAEADTYELRIRYASAEPRPVRIELDDGRTTTLLADAALGDATGSFMPDGQRWRKVAEVDLEPGTHRLTISSDHAFPHLDRLQLASSKAVADHEDAVAAAAQDLDVPAAVLKALDDVRRHHPAFESVVASSREDASDGDGDADSDGPDLAERVAMLDPAAAPEGDEDGIGIHAALFGSGGAFADQALLDAARSDADEQVVAEADAVLAELAATGPPPPIPVLAVEDHAEPSDVALHVRGDHTNAPGSPVARGVPASISGSAAIPTVPENASGRLQLAEWLADPLHPLTARVFVNRVWHWHFGRGLVDTPSDFGTRGGSPSHPELLDRLATDFVAGGWNVKDLHRRIMASRTYRQSSARRAAAAAIDPENRLLWRWAPRRLEAEAIRDSMLAVSGELDPTMGGSLLGVGNFAYVTNDQSANAARYDAPRRSLYLPVIRNALYPFFSTFDYTDAGISEGCRARTVIAPQALFMLNSPFVERQAAAWATRLRSTPDDAEPAALDAEMPADRAPHAGEGRIERAYLEAFARRPAVEEASLGLEFLAAQAPLGEEEAWRRYLQVLLATNEFITID